MTTRIEHSCPSCLAGYCERCDGTAWLGNRPTYCACWAFGHGYAPDDDDAPDDAWQTAQDRYERNFRD